MAHHFNYKSLLIVLGLIIFNGVAYSAEQNLTPAEIEARQQEIVQKMLEISPSAQLNPGITTTEVIEAFEAARKKIRQSDYLMEKIDDAYTSGDFDQAEALIRAAVGLAPEQQERCDRYLLAINREKQARAYATAIKQNQDSVTEKKPQYKEGFFSAVVKSPWTWVAVGGIAVGTASYFYLNQNSEHRYTVPAIIHW